MTVLVRDSMMRYFMEAFGAECWWMIDCDSEAQVTAGYRRP